MGYLTFHELSVFTDDTLTKTINNDKYDEIVELLGKVTDYEDMLFEDTIKWYEHDEDMIRLSKQYPDYVFQLDGDGEESDDFWRTYYKNGKKQEVDVKRVYGEYNPDELKDEVDIKNASTDRKYF